jgi:small conductance mechanosensitive channel
LVAVRNLGDNAVEILFRFWTNKEDYWDTKCDTLEVVKERFDKEGISFPFPQRDVHIFNEK